MASNDASDRLASLFGTFKSGQTTGSPRTPASHPLEGAAQSHQSLSPSGQQTDAQSNLLGLLKFQPTQPAEPARPASFTSPETHSVHGRGISASDLVASLRGTPSSKPPTPAQPTPRSSSTSHQESLLKLLNQTAAAAEDVKDTAPKHQHAAREDTPSRQSPSVRVFGSKEATPTAFEPEAFGQRPVSDKKDSIFTYVNPFEQLSASSPLNVQPRLKMQKRGGSTSPVPTKAPSQPNLTTSANEVLQSIETPEPRPGGDDRSKDERLMDIGAPSKDTETVAEALNEVGDQVHKQMETALNKAEREQPEKALDNIKGASTKDAVPVEGPEGQIPPTNETTEVKDLGILTYQVPMKPFVHIEIKKTEPGQSLREDCIVNIARFRKDFDQIDRTLASASRDYIVYGVAKNGGVRLIHQDSGASKLLFPAAQDRIFNVSLSNAPAQPGLQCVLGTGVSGSVYWTVVANSGGDLEDADIESHSLVIPPTLATESVSNGQLKTRAKRSNRHPDLFAIGRGKSIHIVFPEHARRSKLIGQNHALDTEAYFADRSLKVTTGKSGKDFAFSEDDTVIATLDKAGKLRLWDVRDLTHPDNATASILAPVEVKTPLLTFSTASATEKTWPTSVLFVDKIRSYQKGVAQRYIVVGMKQNHTLQLWDLCLGKAVQEVSFPHESETDAICSVVFHPESSTIIVGHPTRNSIYIIQLSAPKFHLPGLSQAKLATRLANKDQGNLPKTEATAIMSNFREYSLSSIGQLRSLDIAPAASEPPSDEPEEAGLFDLYVMHSRGVTCLGFRKEDLGASLAGKAIHPIDSEKAGHIVIKELREPPQSTAGAPAPTNAEAPPAIPAKSTSRPATKEQDKADRSATPSGSTKTRDRVEKKKAAKAEAAGDSTTKVPKSASQAALLTPRESSPAPEASNGAKEPAHKQAQKNSFSALAEGGIGATEEKKGLSNGQSISLGISSDLLDKEMKKIERGVMTEFNKSFQRELEALHRRLDSDKQVQNATIGANQEAILRLVSKQLGDNVQKSLASIVLKSVKESVTPSVSEVTGEILEKSLPHVVGQQIEHLLPLHLKSALPDALARVFQTKDMHRSITEMVTQNVTQRLEREIMDSVQRAIIPRFQELAVGTAQKLSQDTENRVQAQLQQAEVQRRNDGAKIDQLQNSVQLLSETIQHMARAQSDFQAEFLKLQQKTLQDSRGLARHGSPTPSDSVSMLVSPEQREIDNASSLMQKGQFEEATILWLQSAQQVQLFDQVFARYRPDYLHQIPSLVALSVGAAITTSFENNLDQRLVWLDSILSSLDPNHPEIQQVVRKVMDFIIQRLSDLYMHTGEGQANNPAILRQIAQLTRHARDIMARSPVTAD